MFPFAADRKDTPVRSVRYTMLSTKASEGQQAKGLR